MSPHVTGAIGRAGGSAPNAMKVLRVRRGIGPATAAGGCRGSSGSRAPQAGAFSCGCGIGREPGGEALGDRRRVAQLSSLCVLALRDKRLVAGTFEGTSQVDVKEAAQAAKAS